SHKALVLLPISAAEREGASFALDGRPFDPSDVEISATADALSLAIEPGQHTLTVSRPGLTLEQTFRISENQSIRLTPRRTAESSAGEVASTAAPASGGNAPPAGDVPLTLVASEEMRNAAAFELDGAPLDLAVVGRNSLPGSIDVPVA